MSYMWVLCVLCLGRLANRMIVMCSRIIGIRCGRWCGIINEVEIWDEPGHGTGCCSKKFGLVKSDSLCSVWHTYSFLACSCRFADSERRRLRADHHEVFK